MFLLFNEVSGPELGGYVVGVPTNHGVVVPHHPCCALQTCTEVNGLLLNGDTHQNSSWSRRYWMTVSSHGSNSFPVSVISMLIVTFLPSNLLFFTKATPNTLSNR